MTGSLTVDADRAVAGHRGEGALVTLKAGRARRQSIQRIQAASVDTQLTDLLAIDHSADRAGVGLHADRRRFNRNRLRYVADFQLEVDAGTVTDVEHDALFLARLEAFRFGADVVVADAQTGDHILAVAICDARTTGPSFEVCKSNYGVRNHRTR